MEHGTKSMYNRGCHCPECSKANAEYSRWYRMRRGTPEQLRAEADRLEAKARELRLIAAEKAGVK